MKSTKDKILGIIQKIKLEANHCQYIKMFLTKNKNTKDKFLVYKGDLYTKDNNLISKNYKSQNINNKPKMNKL